MVRLKSHYNPKLIEVGCDEAGRGCLSGPVYAAAVIFDKKYSNLNLKDSKQLSENQRIALKEIVETEAIAYNVAFVEAKVIDKINILNASILAMHKAIEGLFLTPEHILVDGNRFKPYKKIKHTCIVKGDTKYMSIAAASILAKTSRDAFMKGLHSDYPCYNWKSNKGYPTKEHKAAIKEFGITDHHRKSFKLNL